MVKYEAERIWCLVWCFGGARVAGNYVESSSMVGKYQMKSESKLRLIPILLLPHPPAYRFATGYRSRYRLGAVIIGRVLLEIIIQKGMLTL